MFVLLQVRRVFTLIALLEERCTLTLLALPHTDTNYACKHTHTRIHTQINHTHTRTHKNKHILLLHLLHQLPVQSLSETTAPQLLHQSRTPSTWHSEKTHTGQHHYSAIEVTVFTKYLAQ